MFDGLTEEELRLLERNENDYDKDLHLYEGQEVGDIIVGKLPDEEYLDEESALARRKNRLLPGQLTTQRKGFLRIVKTTEITRDKGVC